MNDAANARVRSRLIVDGWFGLAKRMFELQTFIILLDQCKVTTVPVAYNKGFCTGCLVAAKLPRGEFGK